MREREREGEGERKEPSKYRLWGSAARHGHGVIKHTDETKASNRVSEGKLKGK